MVLYFSGTGNSAYIAKNIGCKIQDEVVNLLEKIKFQTKSVCSIADVFQL